ncbi:murein hydrolase activator EnvC family protein [Novosphingobium sp.]|uniref:murein hydrolase activator EnvC family protein n=1 Tax=Novosphingobium sp. TaxID=1874826 RepID=UPI0038BA10A9
MSRRALLSGIVAVLLAPALLVTGLGMATRAVLAQNAPFETADEAARALREAQGALSEAQSRAGRLEAQAERATAAADRTARESAAVAARIQQAEAEIALANARIALIDRQRAGLRLRIARQQEPVVRLTAALQLMARRPLVFSVVRSDSLQDTVYLRAVLETVLPDVRHRTAGLRAEVLRGRALQDSARNAAVQLRQGERALAGRRQQLAALESGQRIAQRAAQGSASRESDRMLALAEQTRDLSGLMQQLQQEGALRAELAALPGPVPRPAAANEVRPIITPSLGLTNRTSAFVWLRPVTGRIVTGFGEAAQTGPTRGITLATAAGAQVIAPGAGRVAFAGPYRGFGQIVIVEHDGGWSTLLTYLGRLDVGVGDTVLQGSPLGSAGQGRPIVGVELRRDGVPVNPLDFLKDQPARP